MISFLQKRQSTRIHKAVSAFIAFSFIFTSVVPPQASYAQVAPQPILALPTPGAMVTTTPDFAPALIKGITIHPENPLKFDFLIHKGDSGFSGDALKEETRKVIKYFLAGLTVPEEEIWVNLSPYEAERIIPDTFGQTEMGRDLLAQDYILKQLTASLIYPENDLGKTFWDRVHAKAYEQYGVTDVPMDTFHKVWIVPERAVVFEKENTAYVADSHLKVMLEEDYLAVISHQSSVISNPKKQLKTDNRQLMTTMIKEIVIPEIEKEVNSGKNFAQLRQIYDSVILAAWYKQNLKETLLGKVYVDQNKTAGVDHKQNGVNKEIYNQYLQAFKAGVYDYIKEDYDPATQETIPRKYFSGGTALTVDAALLTVTDETMLPAQAANQLAALRDESTDTVLATVALAESQKGTDDRALAAAIESQPEEAQRQGVIPADSAMLSLLFDTPSSGIIKVGETVSEESRLPLSPRELVNEFEDVLIGERERLREMVDAIKFDAPGHALRVSVAIIQAKHDALNQLGEVLDRLPSKKLLLSLRAKRIFDNFNKEIEALFVKYKGWVEFRFEASDWAMSSERVELEAAIQSVETALDVETPDAAMGAEATDLTVSEVYELLESSAAAVDGIMRGQQSVVRQVLGPLASQLRSAQEQFLSGNSDPVSYSQVQELLRRIGMFEYTFQVRQSDKNNKVLNTTAKAEDVLSDLKGALNGTTSDAAMSATIALDLLDQNEAAMDGLRLISLKPVEMDLQFSAREFLDKVITPQKAVLLDETNNIEDANGILNWLTRTVKTNGGPKAVGAAFPKKYGGSELGAVSETILTEEIALRSQSVALIYDVWNALTAFPVNYAGTEEQKEKYLKPLLAGDHFLAFGLTEPGSGSDSAGSMGTTAARDGNEFVLKGTKHFITVGTKAKYAVVFAVTDKEARRSQGISAFIVPLDGSVKGVTVNHMSTMLGHRGTGTAEIVLEDARIPEENLLGGEQWFNRGFEIQMKTLESGRISISSIILASLEASLQETEKEYRALLTENVLSIGEMYTWQRTIKKLRVDAYASRLLLRDAARAKDRGEYYNLQAALAKLKPSEDSRRNVVLAMEMVGPKSLQVGHRLERTLRDDRLLQIGEGTTQIMHLVVRNELRKKYMQDNDIPKEAQSEISFAQTINHYLNVQEIGSLTRNAINQLLDYYSQTEDEYIRGRIEIRVVELLAEGQALSLMEQERQSLPEGKEREKGTDLEAFAAGQVEALAERLIKEVDAMVSGEDDLAQEVEEFLPEEWYEFKPMVERFFNDVKEELSRLQSIDDNPNRARNVILGDVAELGFLGTTLKDPYGLGIDTVVRDLILGKAAEVDLSLALMMLEQEKGMAALERFLNSEDKEEVLAQLTSGKRKIAVIIGDDQPAINGALADSFIVFDEVEGEGLTAFYVERKDLKEDEMTIRGNRISGLSKAGAANVEFDTAGVILGKAGQGREILDFIRSIEQSANVQIAKGAARSSIVLGRNYAENVRQQFGQFIINFPAVREMLEESEEDMARMDEENAARLLQNIRTRIVQVYGGAGYDKDTPVPEMWIDAQAWNVLNAHSGKIVNALTDAAMLTVVVTADDVQEFLTTTTFIGEHETKYTNGTKTRLVQFSLQPQRMTNPDPDEQVRTFFIRDDQGSSVGTLKINSVIVNEVGFVGLIDDLQEAIAQISKKRPKGSGYVLDVEDAREELRIFEERLARQAKDSDAAVGAEALSMTVGELRERLKALWILAQKEDAGFLQRLREQGGKAEDYAEDFGLFQQELRRLIGDQPDAQEAGVVLVDRPTDVHSVFVKGRLNDYLKAARSFANNPLAGESTIFTQFLEKAEQLFSIVDVIDQIQAKRLKPQVTERMALAGRMIRERGQWLKIVRDDAVSDAALLSQRLEFSGFTSESKSQAFRWVFDRGIIRLEFSPYRTKSQQYVLNLNSFVDEAKAVGFKFREDIHSLRADGQEVTEITFKEEVWPLIRAFLRLIVSQPKSSEKTVTFTREQIEAAVANSPEINPDTAARYGIEFVRGNEIRLVLSSGAEFSEAVVLKSSLTLDKLKEEVDSILDLVPDVTNQEFLNIIDKIKEDLIEVVRLIEVNSDEQLFAMQFHNGLIRTLEGAVQEAGSLEDGEELSQFIDSQNALIERIRATYDLAMTSVEEDKRRALESISFLAAREPRAYKILERKIAELARKASQDSTESSLKILSLVKARFLSSEWRELRKFPGTLRQRLKSGAESNATAWLAVAFAQTSSNRGEELSRKIGSSGEFQILRQDKLSFARALRIYDEIHGIVSDAAMGAELTIDQIGQEAERLEKLVAQDARFERIKNNLSYARQWIGSKQISTVKDFTIMFLGSLKRDTQAVASSLNKDDAGARVFVKELNTFFELFVMTSEEIEQEKEAGRRVGDLLHTVLDPASEHAEDFKKGGYGQNGYGVAAGAANNGSFAIDDEGNQGYFVNETILDGEIKSGKQVFIDRVNSIKERLRKRAERNGKPIKLVIKTGIGGQHTPFQGISDVFQVIDSEAGLIIGEYELGKDFKAYLEGLVEEMGIDWNQILIIPSSKSGSTDETMDVFVSIFKVLLEKIGGQNGMNGVGHNLTGEEFAARVIYYLHEINFKNGKEVPSAQLFSNFDFEQLVRKVKPEQWTLGQTRENVREILGVVLGNMHFETTDDPASSRLSAFVRNSGLDQLLGEDAPGFGPMFDNVGGRWTADLHIMTHLAFYDLDPDIYWEIRNTGIRSVRGRRHVANALANKILDEGITRIALVVDDPLFWFGKDKEQNFNESIWQDGFANLKAIKASTWGAQSKHYAHQEGTLVINLSALGIKSEDGFNVYELVPISFDKLTKQQLAERLGDLYTTFYGMTYVAGTRLIARALKREGYAPKDVDINDLDNPATQIVQENLFLRQPFVEFAKKMLEDALNELQEEQARWIADGSQGEGPIDRELKKVMEAGAEKKAETNIERLEPFFANVSTEGLLGWAIKHAAEYAKQTRRTLVPFIYYEGQGFLDLRDYLATLEEKQGVGVDLQWILQGTGDQHISYQQVLRQPQAFLPFIVSVVPHSEEAVEPAKPAIGFTKGYLDNISPHFTRDLFAWFSYEALVVNQAEFGGEGAFMRITDSEEDMTFLRNAFSNAKLPLEFTDDDYFELEAEGAFRVGGNEGADTAMIAVAAPGQLGHVFESDHGLRVKQAQVQFVKGNGDVNALLEDPLAAYLISSSSAAAVGSFYFRGRGKKTPSGQGDFKVAGDANALHFIDQETLRFVQTNPEYAVIELASEGLRDGSVSTPVARIYHVDFENGYMDFVEFEFDDKGKGYIKSFDIDGYKQALDFLTVEGIQVLYKVTDSLEKTEGLVDPEAMDNPTDSWALNALIVDSGKGAYKLPIDDNFRTAAISYHAPQKADIGPMDMPSEALPKIARANGLMKGTQAYTDFMNNVTFVILGPRGEDLKDVDSSDSRHKHFIADVLRFKEENGYEGMRVDPVTDGDLMPRLMALTGPVELNDYRNVIVFGRSGSAEAEAARAWAKTVEGAHQVSRRVSTKATAGNVSYKTADNYTDQERATNRILGYTDDALTKVSFDEEENLQTLVVMTSVTGATEHLGENFRDTMQRVDQNFSEKTITTSTIMSDKKGNVYVVKVTYESTRASLGDSVATIVTSHPEAQRVVEEVSDIVTFDAAILSDSNRILLIRERAHASLSAEDSIIIPALVDYLNKLIDTKDREFTFDEVKAVLLSFGGTDGGTHIFFSVEAQRELDSGRAPLRVMESRSETDAARLASGQGPLAGEASAADSSESADRAMAAQKPSAATFLAWFNNPYRRDNLDKAVKARDESEINEVLRPVIQGVFSAEQPQLLQHLRERLLKGKTLLEAAKSSGFFDAAMMIVREMHFDNFQSKRMRDGKITQWRLRTEIDRLQDTRNSLPDEDFWGIRGSEGSFIDGMITSLSELLKNGTFFASSDEAAQQHYNDLKRGVKNVEANRVVIQDYLPSAFVRKIQQPLDDELAFLEIVLGKRIASEDQKEKEKKAQTAFQKLQRERAYLIQRWKEVRSKPDLDEYSVRRRGEKQTYRYGKIKKDILQRLEVVRVLVELGQAFYESDAAMLDELDISLSSPDPVLRKMAIGELSENIINAKVRKMLEDHLAVERDGDIKKMIRQILTESDAARLDSGQRPPAGEASAADSSESADRAMAVAKTITREVGEALVVGPYVLNVVSTDKASRRLEIVKTIEGEEGQRVVLNVKDVHHLDDLSATVKLEWIRDGGLAVFKIKAPRGIEVVEWERRRLPIDDILDDIYITLNTLDHNGVLPPGEYFVFRRWEGVRTWSGLKGYLEQLLLKIEPSGTSEWFDSGVESSYRYIKDELLPKVEENVAAEVATVDAAMLGESEISLSSDDPILRKIAIGELSENIDNPTVRAVLQARLEVERDGDIKDMIREILEKADAAITAESDRELILETEIIDLLRRLNGGVIQRQISEAVYEGDYAGVRSVVRQEVVRAFKGQKPELTDRLISYLVDAFVDGEEVGDALYRFLDSEKSVSDDAMTPVGGIDLSKERLNLQIKRDGRGVPLPVNLQPLETINIEGFLPIILEMRPVTSLPLLSAIQAEGKRKTSHHTTESVRPELSLGDRKARFEFGEAVLN